jgi:hypothetical protein
VTRKLRDPDAATIRSHVIVALETANLALKRPVTSREVESYLPAEIVRNLRRRYRNPPADTVRAVLSQTVGTGGVYAAGLVRTRRYFASEHIIDPKRASLKSIAPSRSQRVLSLVRRSVAVERRGVRTQDLVAHAQPKELEGLTTEMISRTLGGLAGSGVLRVVATIRSRESNLYLPADLDPNEYAAAPPHTMRDGILKVFHALWREHEEGARATQSLPRPVSIGEICARFITEFGACERKVVSFAMGILAKEPFSGVRRIERNVDAALLWAPASVPDASLGINDTFTSDAERVTEAIRRAEMRYRRPVTAAEACEEGILDRLLQPRGSRAYNDIVKDVARQLVPGTKGRKPRHRVHIFHIGRIGQRSFYSAANTPVARGYVRFQQILREWHSGDAVAELDGLTRCSLDALAFGRAVALQERTSSAAEELRSILDLPLEHAFREDAEALLREVTEVDDAARRASESRHLGNLPTGVRTRVPSWSSEQVVAAIGCIYPSRALTPATLVGLLGKYLRRTPSQRPRARSHERQYDATDMLLYAALQWGGRECSIQASICRSELGLLRDDRFVVPILAESNPSKRLKAIACCAFLHSADGLEQLKGIATHDPEVGVRAAAAWADGFAQSIRAAVCRTARPEDTLRWWLM